LEKKIAVMMFFYIIGFFSLLIASVCDFKKKEIPDILSYSFIMIIFFLRILFSFERGFLFFLEGILGMVALGVFGTVLFYLGLWGGGDVKILIALGGLFGLGFELSLISPLIIFFACIAVAGSFYGVIFMFVLSMINFKSFKKRFSVVLRKNKKRILVFFFFFLALVIIASLMDKSFFLIGFLFLFFFFFLFFLFLVSKTLEKIYFKKIVDVEKLTEGDWLSEEIKSEGVVVFKSKKEGLYKKDIEKLIQMKKNGIIDKVEIKTGMPFVPVFFFAFILFIIVQLSGFLKIFLN
jgi:hypothetical protein